MIEVKAVCVAKGHEQSIMFGDEIGVPWAEEYAGFLDGTSPHYKYSPIGTDSPIGKCGICNSQIRATVSQR